jgi:predicted dehydrogenase
MIGFGFIAENGHLPAYLSGATRASFEIAAVADVSPARRALAHAKLPHARIYSDARELFASERHLDFADIATPPCDHASLAHLALDRGLHVLCEKPLTTTGLAAQELLDHAERARRVLFPAHEYKYAPVVRAVREVLEQSLLGPIHLVSIQTFRPTHARGVPEFQPDWRRMRAYSGGGIAMDHGSHAFYLAFEWLASYPTAVSASSSARPGFDTEDDFNCTVTFPRGLATVQLSWNAGLRRVIYSLHGSKGGLVVSDDDLEVSLLAADGGRPLVSRRSIRSNWMSASHEGWFAALFDDFSAAIDRREWVPRETSEALHCVRLIETAYRSARASGHEQPLVTMASSEVLSPAVP